MKINLTLEFSDEDRRVLMQHWGNKTPASRVELTQFIRSSVDATLQDYRCRLLEGQEHVEEVPK